jgi:hypothetical protein
MTDENDQAKALMRRVFAEVERFLDELSPEQLAALEDGTASLTLVPVDQDDEADRSPAGCTCPCRHRFGCLTCSCTCPGTGPNARTCRCCGADDDALTTGRPA